MRLIFQTRQMPLPPEVYVARQVHGVKALRITPADAPAEIAQVEADALWTTAPGISVGIRTADCAPVLLYERTGQVVAAVHAGWRGAVEGIVPKTLQEICQTLCLSPPDFEAHIGPCIGAKFYEIGPEVAQLVPPAFLKQGLKDRSFFDLRRFLEHQLRMSGVLRVQVSAACTYSEPESYYSHRRHDTGRQYSYISL